MFPQPRYNFKIVLVGDSSVGKSSILTRFVDDQFHDGLVATIGVDFKFRRIKIEKQQVKLQIWDTAGQQTFRSLVSAYYHSADAIIIVYDITIYKSFESIVQYWIKQAENNSKDHALIFLIGNKVDVANDKRDVQSFSVQTVLAKHKIKKSFEVSAKSGENIEEAFKEISKILIQKVKSVQHGEQKRLTHSAPNLKHDQIGNTKSKKKKCCEN